MSGPHMRLYPRLMNSELTDSTAPNCRRCGTAPRGLVRVARFCTGSLAAMGLLILSLSSEPGVRAAEIVDLDENILHGLIAEGGLITFGVDGTVTLSRTLNITKDTILDGSGHSVTLSGMDAVRVFYVNTNVTLTLSNLTIASGRSDTGAGMYNAGGNVDITGCRFINNQARGTNGISDSYLTSAGGCGAGGAIFNAGDLWVTNSELSTNAAFGGSGAVMGTPGGRGGGAEGGAVYNVGRVWIAGTSFITNRAFAGNGGDATSAADPTNMIRGGTGGAGGYGRGGAVSSLGLVEISSSSFDHNVANAGRGGTGAGDEFARGGAGGDGEAGALYNSGTLALTNCSFRFNLAIGGDSGYGYFSPRGASALGGSVCNAGVLTANSRPWIAVIASHPVRAKLPDRVFAFWDASASRGQSEKLIVPLAAVRPVRPQFWVEECARRD